MSFNGHKNWNQWNVSLWVNNDEGLYNLAKEQFRRNKTLDDAALCILYCLEDIGITETPDGANYNVTSIHNAIRGI